MTHTSSAAATPETRVDGRTGPPRDPAYPCLQPPQDPDEIGRLGGYRVLRLLGEGGMGMVFLAEDVALQRLVALKVMKYDADGAGGEGMKRFLREARTMAGIKDQHLVTVFQAGVDGTTAYMAMELLDGESLHARLSRNDWPPPPECLRIAREAAAGLATIHANGLVHRDIKPSNLWVEAGTGRVKILDFGLVREVHADTQITQTGMIVGTPAFLAPEQARGKRCDGRTDLFSLGCVLYHLCTGEQPFPAENAMEQLVAVVADEPVPLRKSNPDVPERLARLVHAMLAKNPDRRPPSAAAVAEELRQIEADLRAPDVDAAFAELAAPRTAPTKRLVSAVRAEVVKDRSSRVRRTTRRKKKKSNAWVLPAACVAVVVVVSAAAVAFSLARAKPPAKDTPPEAADPVPKATPAAPATRVFLTSLGMTEKQNHPFEPPPGLPWPPGDITRVVVNGKHSPNGLMLHPRDLNDPARVTFDVGGGFKSFAATVSVNDSARGGSQNPMTFAVYLDGKRRWVSDPVQTAADAQRLQLDVTGAKLLTLEVSTSGMAAGAHGAWVEPALTK
jgi:serine/threonine protein kinase